MSGHSQLVDVALWLLGAGFGAAAATSYWHLRCIIQRRSPQYDRTATLTEHLRLRRQIERGADASE